MKTYIYYFNGMEIGMLKAKSHNAAEAKAKEKAVLAAEYDRNTPPITNVSVAYTEI